MSRNSGLGLRLICLCITLISVICSILLGFFIHSEKKAAEKYETAIAYANAQIGQNQTAVEDAEIQTEALKAQKKLIQEEIAAIEKMKYYEEHPVAFLTFDDGPSANTLEILDILKEYNVPATFFVVGDRLSGSSSTLALQRIISEGHVLAMHANEHVYETIYASKAAYFNDLDTLKDRLFDLTGVTPDIVRMPGGTASAYSFFGKYAKNSDIYYDVLDELEMQGIALCDWNVETKDYSSSTGVNNIIKNALNGAQTRASGKYKYKATIILMHDRKDTIEALPEIIEGLMDMGFEFEGLDAEGYIYRQK